MSEQPINNQEIKDADDVSDLVNTKTAITTYHRPDGKFLSRHEIALIKDNQDLIRDKSPEILDMQEELKTQFAALKMEDKYPSGNQKVRPAIITKIQELENKLGKDKTQETKIMAGLVDHTPKTMEQAIADGEYTNVQKSGIKAFIATKLASHFSGASSALFREKSYAKASDHKERKHFVRAAAYATLGAVGVYSTMMIAERYLGFGVSEALGADGPTGGSGATGVTEHRVQMEQAHPSTLQVDTSPDNQSATNYNRFEQNSHDRMSTHGAFDGTERTSTQLDDHVLAKIQNNPSLMASVMEVRESGNKDANFSLDDVNHDTHNYAVHGENGTYSGKGQDAVETLEKSWNNGHQGRLLSDERVSDIMKKYEFVNHGTNEGDFKNALDDKTYSAGVFDYRPELGDKIYGKELGNGEVVYFKVNEKDSSRDCLNILTVREKGVDIPFTPSTPGNPNTPTPDTDTPTPIIDEPPTTDNSKKPWEAPQGHDNGDHPAGKPKPTTDQDLGGNVDGGKPTQIPADTTERPANTTIPTEETGAGGSTGTNSTESQSAH